jgi:hypothetical protein
MSIPGCVYFAELRERVLPGHILGWPGTGLAIKVGFSRSPLRRIEALSAASPFTLVPLAIVDGSFEDEQCYHRRLAGFRLKGEWYRVCREVCDFVFMVGEQLSVSWAAR